MKSTIQNTYTPVDTKTHMGGVHERYQFDNGYGASVIRNELSYGGKEGLYELAVLVYDPRIKRGYDLCYDTPITEDVIGHLPPEGVEEYLRQISELPTRKD